MATWLAERAGERRGAARRDVELAAAVSSVPAVADGLAGGALSKAKAAELARASAASAEEQATLVEAATTSSVEQLARTVDRWQIEHQPETTPVEEFLLITPTPGGGRVEAQLDTEGLEWVQVAVDAAAEQLGLRDLPWAQRRAKGLVAACRYFVAHADIPATRGGRPTVVVTVDIDTLAADSGGSARLDSGAYVRGDVARRLACDAGIVRIITDPTSMPLDVGRRTRVPRPSSSVIDTAPTPTATPPMGLRNPSRRPLGPTPRPHRPPPPHPALLAPPLPPPQRHQAPTRQDHSDAAQPPRAVAPARPSAPSRLVVRRRHVSGLGPGGGARPRRRWPAAGPAAP
jgi:hypothetical protein